VEPGPTPISPPTFKDGGGPATPPDFFAPLAGLEDALKHDPKGLGAVIRGLYGTLIILASAVSFIPGEANVGGGLASLLIHDIIEPFRSRVYAGSLDLALRPFFPNRFVSPRILLSAMQDGLISEKDIVDELTLSGTLDSSIQSVVKYARAKAFDTATKGDIALVRQYHTKLIDYTIVTLQDIERAAITDLKGLRAAAITELTKIRGSRLSALEAVTGGV